MLVKKTIAEQIALIEKSGNMIVLEVTKHGNFMCLDKNLLDQETWADDSKTELSGKTRLDHIKADESWKKYHPKLREAGIIG